MWVKKKYFFLIIHAWERETHTSVSLLIYLLTLSAKMPACLHIPVGKAMMIDNHKKLNFNCQLQAFNNFTARDKLKFNSSRCNSVLLVSLFRIWGAVLFFYCSCLIKYRLKNSCNNKKQRWMKLSKYFAATCWFYSAL